MASLVSLPEHLRETLLALLEVQPPPVLLDELATQLRAYVTPPEADPALAASAKRTIPYSLLSEISKHVRSPRCKPALEAHALDPREYEMISLLAGVRTITTATADPPQTTDTARKTAAKQWAEDRRALSAVLNGLFSVGGVGFAAWYAAGSAGWKEEWRALVALFAGLVVAASEAVLFVIWQDRTDKRRLREKARRERKASLPEKARDTDDHTDADNEAEKKRAPAEPQPDTPVLGDGQAPVPTIVGKNISKATEPGEDDLQSSEVLLEQAAEEHPTLRRRVPPVGIPETGSDNTS